MEVPTVSAMTVLSMEYIDKQEEENQQLREEILVLRMSLLNEKCLNAHLKITRLR